MVEQTKYKLITSSTDWKDEDEILNHVKNEYDTSWDLVQKKVKLFNNRMNLYTNLDEDIDGKQKDERKIYVRKIYTTMQTLLSLFYQDEIEVSFEGRQLGDKEIAENLQRISEFDFEEMNMDKLSYQVQRDRLFFGVGIRVFKYRNKEKKFPVFEVVDPRAWIPDLNPDQIDGYRYHGFEMEAGKSELTEEYGFFNIDKIQNVYNDETEERKQADAKNRKLAYEERENQLPNEKYSIYYHYTMKNGKIYLIVLANDKNLVIKIEEFDWLKTFPVIINQFDPLRGDPWGVSLPDLLEDKQKAEQLFMNLNRIKAEYETWGDTFFYDPDVIRNIEDAQVPSQGPKYIAANLSQSNGSPIIEVPKGQVKSDSFNMPLIIGNQANKDVGVDERTLGISGSGSLTATENQRVQKNANLRFVLKNKINSWGEKHFWKVWYNSYKAFFKTIDKKNIYINSGLGSTILSLNKNKIISNNDIDIKITNKSDLELKNQRERDGFLSVGMGLINDPSLPKISRDYAKRKMLRMLDIPKEEVMVMIPPTIEEMQSKEDIELINHEDMPGIKSLEEDHYTYIVMYQNAVDNRVKYNSIKMREKAFVMSGQKQMMANAGMQQQEGDVTKGLQNGMANQMMANRMSDQRGTQGASSLEDINQ